MFGPRESNFDAVSATNSTGVMEVEPSEAPLLRFAEVPNPVPCEKPKRLAPTSSCRNTVMRAARTSTNEGLMFSTRIEKINVSGLTLWQSSEGGPNMGCVVLQLHAIFGCPINPWAVLFFGFKL